MPSRAPDGKSKLGSVSTRRRNFRLDLSNQLGCRKRRASIRSGVTRFMLLWRPRLSAPFCERSRNTLNDKKACRQTFCRQERQNIHSCHCRSIPREVVKMSFSLSGILPRPTLIKNRLFGIQYDSTMYGVHVPKAQDTSLTETWILL